MTLTQGAFLWILQKFAKFFIEHLRTAASEIVTENTLGNSARNGKLHIIIPIDVWGGSKSGLCKEAYFEK